MQTGNILVTGGAGFIGSNFVMDWIAATGGTVINLDKLTYAGSQENLRELDGDERHVFVQGDIADRRLVHRLLVEHRPAAVLNFAAESHVDRSIDSPSEFIQTNIVGVHYLLEESLTYWRTLSSAEQAQFRFLHVSTDEVYGSLGAEDPSFTEETSYRPNSPYAASKASADHLVRAYHKTYCLPMLTTNCSNNYGPRQYPEKLIPVMMLNALAGRPLPIYGDGANVRDWLYVGDHCSAIRQVLQHGRTGETYNIGGECEMTNLDVVRTMCGILDDVFPESPWLPHDQLISFVEDRPGHDRRYAINAEKIRAELGWRPAESFETGFRKTVRWYIENLDWCTRVRTAGDSGERLGLLRQHAKV